MHVCLGNLDRLENLNYLCKISCNVTIKYMAMVIKGSPESHAYKCMGVSVGGSVISRNLSSTGMILLM